MAIRILGEKTENPSTTLSISFAYSFDFIKVFCFQWKTLFFIYIIEVVHNVLVSRQWRHSLKFANWIRIFNQNFQIFLSVSFINSYFVKTQIKRNKSSFLVKSTTTKQSNFFEYKCIISIKANLLYCILLYWL